MLSEAGVPSFVSVITDKRKDTQMALFMDFHDLPGVTPEAVAEAHEKDLAVQARHDVRYLNYWVDPAAGRVFCLVQAPSADVAAQVHREAHGLVADEIFAVEQG